MEMVIAPGSNISSQLSQHFCYELSDKKAKSNILKSANREVLEVIERQMCIMLDLSTGAYLELIIPAVAEWTKVKGSKITIDNLIVEIEDVSPGYDENMKHVQTIVRFVANSNRVTITCYNTTQRIKAEGKGYQNFVTKFLKPYLMQKLSKDVNEKIEKYNKEVIAVLSGKRKVITRPMRRVKYKPMGQLLCSKCELSFKNEAQLKKHKSMMHTKVANESTGSIRNALMVEDLSLLSESDGEPNMEKNCGELEYQGGILQNTEKHSVSIRTDDEEPKIEDLLDDCDDTQQVTLEEKSGETLVLTFKCNYCASMFTADSELNSHVQEKHGSPDREQMCTVANIEKPPDAPITFENKENIVCCLCKLESKNVDALRKHIQNIHGNDISYEKKQDVIEKQVSETVTACEKCGYMGSKDELSQHLRLKHGQSFKCDECGNDFPDVCTLKDHKDAQHSLPPQIDPFPCEWCGLYFSTFGLLEEHVQNYHRQQTLEHCHYCSEVFGTLEDLQSHMRAGHEEVVILCTVARQVDNMNDKFDDIMKKVGEVENNKDKLDDIMNKINVLTENQNVMMQELFILRNKLTDTTENRTKAEANVKKESINMKVNKSPEKTYRKKPQKEDARTLFVGDSISVVADMKALKEATETEVVCEKAYTAVFDTVSNEAKNPARYPHRNYNDVIPTALEKEPFKNMIVQSGSVDITNLKTSKEAEKHFDYFNQQTVMSAENLFQTCEKALKTNSNLEKVVIMKNIPRYDRVDTDPLSIKQALSQIYNNTLTDLWMKSPLKNKIFVGNHDLECSGGIRQSRYKNVLSGAFDGIHLYGSSGGKFYTLSALNILKQAGLVKKDFEHQNCEQAKYQSKQRGFMKNMMSWPVDKDVRVPGRQRAHTEAYSIPLKNRFACFSEELTGNF